MEDIEKAVDQFFDAYAGRFNQALEGNIDIEATTNAFAGSFIESSPAGVICGKNNEEFEKAIPKGYEFYKSIGTQSMEILSKKVDIIDGMHLMVKVHWKATYIKKGQDLLPIEFDVFYFIRLENDELKIFAYVTGDEQKVLKDHGMV